MQVTKKENNAVSTDRKEKNAVRWISYFGLHLTPVVLVMCIIMDFLGMDQMHPQGPRFIRIGDIRFMHKILREHSGAVVGLPMAAVLSLWVVTILRYKSGPIEFDVLGFKFRGASGPVILWILCFLIVILGIKLLW